MSRISLIGAAVVLTLGLAAGPSQAAKPKKVKTEAEIEGIRFFPGNQIEIFGDVHSKKSKCEKGRSVTLVYTGTDSEDPMFDATTTDSTGDWVIDPGMLAIPIGPWVVEVARKKVGSGGKKLKCKATTSPEHTFPKL